MTLDEAIRHAEEVAEGYEEDISKWEYTLSEYRKRECVEQTTIPRCEKELNRCKQCASEHRQLAEWMRDYKRLKEKEPSGDAVSRQAVKDLLVSNGIYGYGTLIDKLPPVTPQRPKGHWIMKHRNINKIEYHTGEDVLNDEIHTVKELIRYETNDPYCACCGKRTEDISQDYCGYCGARMV